MVEYNIYCDESCHLENDPHKSMVLGAVWCEKEDRKELFDRIKEKVIRHIQEVRSEEVSLIQLTDLLIGVLSDLQRRFCGFKTSISRNTTRT